MGNPFVHNAKVVWIMGGKPYPVHECYDKSYSLCRRFATLHKNDPQYKGGKLLAVSMLESKYKGI